jgi:phage host-nuclease inhibitor protein Gam
VPGVAHKEIVLEMNAEADIPPGFAHTLNNEDLLAYVRYTSSDKSAADTLKQRWESFWDKDYKTLAKQRFDIDRLINDQTALRQERFKLSQEIGELKSKLEGYENGRKIKALRAQVRSLQKRVDTLTKERNRLKKGKPKTPETPEDELRHEIRRLEGKLSKVASELAVARRRNLDLLLDRRPEPNGRDAIQIIPPFVVFDHPHIIDPNAVARMARILHTW